MNHFLPSLQNIGASNRNNYSKQHLARRKQINTLRIFNENVVEARQDVEFQVTFTVAGELKLIMIIILPQEFPADNSRPIIKVFEASNKAGSSNKLQHPWINDSHDVIGSPGLNAFRSGSTDLGRVVQAIKREFERNPPKVSIQTAPTQTQAPVAAMPVAKTESLPNFACQAEQRSIPEIEKLNLKELEELQNDPIAFRVFLNRLN